MAKRRQEYSPAQTSFMAEIFVDGFAGGGGTSTGYELATGRPADIAINHNPEAIRLHKANHPYTEHYQTSIWEVDPKAACKGRPVGLAWFSPDCTHFSKARGGKPVKKEIRSLSWVVLKWALDVRPRVLMMENVEEIQTWGPTITVIINGEEKEIPDPDRVGETFQAFIGALTTGIPADHPAIEEICEYLHLKRNSPELKRIINGLGYDVEYQSLIAADFGAPTTRKRFALVGRCDGNPIVWPEPTHAPRDSEAVKSGKCKPWRSAAEIIDWALPSYSIFASKQEIKEKYGVDARRPLADNTLRRVISGVDKFTIKSGNPFIIQQKFNNTAQDIYNPLSTITAVGAHELVNPVITPFGVECNHSGGGHLQDLKNPLNTVTGNHTGGVAQPIMAPFTFGNTTGSVGTAVNDPVHTVTTAGNQVLGSPVMAPFTFSNTGGSVGSPANMPVHTIRTAGGQVFAAANLMSIGQTGGGDRIRDVRDPAPTTVTKQEACVVAANLIQYHTEQTENVRASGLNAPIPTIDTANRYGLVSAQLVEYYGNGNPLDIKEPLHTVTSRDREAVVSAHLSEFRSASIGRDMRDPAGTVTSRDHEGVVSAHIQKFYGGVIGEDAREPLPTVTAIDHNALCAAHVVKFKGQELGQHPADTLNTITAQGLEYAECRAVLAKMSPGQDLQYWPQIRELLNKYCGYNLADDEVILLIIRGMAYYIADITLRMLTPRELYNAMGFPPDYIIEWDYMGRTYTKKEQVARCGNAVSPPMAEALIRANFPEWCVVVIDTMAALHSRVTAM